MFGFGKKKEQDNSDLDEVFGTEKKSDARPSRKEAKREQKKQFDIDAQKNEIVDTLKGVYAKVNTTSHYEEADRVMTLMTNLKSGDVDRNARAVYALDGLIKQFVAELKVYCNQDNYYGIMTSIDEITKLVNQRGYVTHKYFEDKQYLKAKIELMKLKVNRENLTTEIDLKIDTFNKLKASAAGQSDARRMQIQKQMLQIKEEKDALQRQSDALDVQIKNVSTLVGQKEQNKDVYLPTEIVDEFGEVLEETKESDAQAAQVTKQAEKIAGANKTVMNQGMTVSDADSTSSTNSTVNLEDMTI